MASSMMHLAVVQEMKKKIRFQNAERLDLGVILPDAAVDGNSHLKRSICGGTKDTYDLEFFREKFGEQMKQDDLYLGYYLHLVQDLYYRNYLYVENNWNSAIPGNVEKLHHDYCVLNGRISQRYGLSKDKISALDITTEPICELAVFDAPGFVVEVQQQFATVSEESLFVLTAEMAEEYIRRAAEFCIKEMENLRNGKNGLDSIAYAWKKPEK